MSRVAYFRGSWFLFCLAAGTLAAGETIVIRGSNTFGEELAPLLIDAYRRAHPTTEIQLESKGSASGIAALLSSECDIASASRYANEDEQRLARSRGLTLKSTLLGFYGVAVIVHAGNPVDRLSDTQVRDVFTGAVTTWKSVGGADAPIHLYIRDPISGTYLGFQELAMERKPYAPSAKTLTSYAAIIDTVARDPGGIGYVSMALAGHNEIKTLRINKVPPSRLTVNEGDYPYTRGLRFYTIKGRESPAVQDFIRFVLSGAGQDVLTKAGFVGRFEQPLWSPEW
jgi:phosphate transport system substrate-binding protein